MGIGWNDVRGPAWRKVRFFASLRIAAAFPAYKRWQVRRGLKRSPAMRAEVDRMLAEAAAEMERIVLFGGGP